MDKLINEFTVARPIDQAWAVLCDLERIAPCMPGAELHEVEGDTYRGVVKIKLGAIGAALKGQATWVERDEVARTAVIRAEGRDTGGKGNADALITAHLVAVDATSTNCVVEADLRFTGKIAQFGRVGVLADVSKKLIGQFSDNLNAMLANEPAVAPTAATTPPSSPTATSTGDSAGDSATAGPTAAAADAPPKVRKIEGPAAAPLELGSVAGPVVKRMLPAFGGVVLLLLLLRSLRRRGR